MSRDEYIERLQMILDKLDELNSIAANGTHDHDDIVRCATDIAASHIDKCLENLGAYL